MTALLGQVHFYPFGTDFRITFGVIMFPLLLMYFHRVSIVSCSVITASMVISLRMGIDIFTTQISFYDAFYRHFPAFMFYISYGIIVYKLNFRKYIDMPIYYIALLSFSDMSSNFFELIIRNQFGLNPFDSILSTLVCAAFIRSALSFSLFWVIRYYNLIIIKDEHQKKYNELLMLAAKLKSEILFLKKSMQDIENAMQKSYSINFELNRNHKPDENTIKKIIDDSLSLAVEIHEIKKDYNRIVLSMEKLIPPIDTTKGMKISEIFNTIGDIFTKCLEIQNKDIKLEFTLENDVWTKEYYVIISILNNLIQNSIEASRNEGAEILIFSCIKKENIIFMVKDNGRGISRKSRHLIFEPGYTTKYDAITGFLSTGLGLTHVKILLQYLNGNITLGDIDEGTQFLVEVPLNRISREGEIN